MTATEITVLGGTDVFSVPNVLLAAVSAIVLKADYWCIRHSKSAVICR
jgi:hypothetical protein